MSPRANTFVRATQIGTAAAAALLSPVPLADELILAPALLAVAAVIGHEQGLPLRALPWSALGKTTLTALAARATLNLASSLLPGLAAVANAVTAYALTGVYAEWADRACRDPRNAGTPTFTEIVAALGRPDRRPPAASAA